MAAKKPKVYLSCEPDWEYRDRMLDGLRAAGYTILSDSPGRIRVGEDIDEVKGAAELRAWAECDYVIVVFSERYLSMARVAQNLQRTLERERIENRAIVLPVDAGTFQGR